jgi:hypothetical protein
MAEREFEHVVEQRRALQRLFPDLGLITSLVEGLVIPTPAEMLRVKAFLLTERRATRDYVDLARISRTPASVRLGASAQLSKPALQQQHSPNHPLPVC